MALDRASEALQAIKLTHQVVQGCESEGHSGNQELAAWWLGALALLRNGPITFFSLGMKWEGIQDI